MPQHLAFEGADWGYSDTQVQNFDNYHDDQLDPSTESTWEDMAEYHSGDVDFDHYLAPNERVEENIDQADEDYMENQTAESLHVDTELQDSTLSSGNFGSVEEDFDLLNSEEVVEDDQ
jgi:hypothetical protein